VRQHLARASERLIARARLCEAWCARWSKLIGLWAPFFKLGGNARERHQHQRRARSRPPHQAWRSQPRGWMEQCGNRASAPARRGSATRRSRGWAPRSRRRRGTWQSFCVCGGLSAHGTTAQANGGTGQLELVRAATTRAALRSRPWRRERPGRLHAYSSRDAEAGRGSSDRRRSQSGSEGTPFRGTPTCTCPCLPYFRRFLLQYPVY
jgi:hypothetical protein